MDALSGAAREKQAMLAPPVVRPELLRSLYKAVGLIQIAGPVQLGKINGGIALQFRHRQADALVAGHVHPEGLLVGETAEGVIEGGFQWSGIHKHTSCVGCMVLL